MKSHVAAPIPAELAAEGRRIARLLQTSDDPRTLAKPTVDVIRRLTDAGLDGFFLQPVQRMGLGFVARSATEVSLKTASKAIALFIRRLSRSLSEEQIRSLGSQLEDILVDLET